MALGDFFAGVDGGVNDHDYSAGVLYVWLRSWRAFGYFNIANPWTALRSGLRVVDDSVFLQSLKNALLSGRRDGPGGGGGVHRGCVYRRSDPRLIGRAVMDMVSWLPSTLPGIILGLGLLSVFLGTPFLRPLYGSMALLIIATVISCMTLGVQVIKGALTQLAVELEEAAQVAGGSAWRSFRDIIVPIIAAQRPARRHFEFHRRGAKRQHGGVNFHPRHAAVVFAAIGFFDRIALRKRRGGGYHRRPVDHRGCLSVACFGFANRH